MAHSSRSKQSVCGGGDSDAPHIPLIKVYALISPLKSMGGKSLLFDGSCAMVWFGLLITQTRMCCTYIYARIQLQFVRFNT